ncbi:MAG: TetR/AcrR family transcriptional regulator [Afipia sp.]|nr:TetR/AcrR family transcriptional regulator [Afipia sp.]
MNIHTRLRNDPKVELLEAARRVLLECGYAGLSTRAVAAQAGTQMSQIRYHFGSKEGMILGLFEYMNDALVDRQSVTFSDPDLSLAEKWRLSCDYLDDDLASGYVRVLQELMAAGYSNAVIGDVVRAALAQWRDLLISIAREFAQRHATAGAFEAEELAALVSAVFLGAEACILLGHESDLMPIRRALRKLGDLMNRLETRVDPE